MKQSNLILLVIYSFILVINASNVKEQNICYGKASGVVLGEYLCEGNLKYGGW